MDKEFLDTIKATNLCTLKEYVYVYPRLMAEYRKLGEDCSEMYFIEEQIEQHFIYIDSYKNARKRILDDGYKEKYGTFEDYHLMVRSFDIRVTSLKAIINFLVSKKSELEKGSRMATVPKEVNENKLTVDQLALKMVYEGNTMVTREKHGDDLYNKFSHWSKRANRTANDGTDRQLNNKIERFEKVIEALAPEDKQQAINEVKILKSYLLNK